MVVDDAACGMTVARSNCRDLRLIAKNVDTKSFEGRYNAAL
jgi:hypothetical protein